MVISVRFVYDVFLYKCSFNCFKNIVSDKRVSLFDFIFNFGQSASLPYSGVRSRGLGDQGYYHR